MSSTFLYDSVVTGEDLDNIYVDLGQSIEYFADYEHNSTSIAISDLNNITADLTSKGVLQIGGELEVATNTDEKTFAIKDGVCVFSDGCKYRRSVDDADNTYPYDTSASTYVYIERNATENTVTLCYGPSQPSTGDFVMLAEITDKGVVNDTRGWSVGKSQNGVNKIVSVDWSIPRLNGSELDELGILKTSIPLNFNHVFIKGGLSSNVQYHGAYLEDGVRKMLRMDDYNYFYLTKNESMITIEFDTADFTPGGFDVTFLFF